MSIRVFAAVVGLGALYLASVIVSAIGAESLLVAGPRIARDPWGWVTIVDLYLGFLLAGAFVVVREKLPHRYLPWLVGIFCLGNLATAVYVLNALRGGSLRLHQTEPAGRSD